MEPNMLESLKQALRSFAAAREWDQFHTPKNLASALIVEAGELLEHFQWRSEKESAALEPETLDKVSLEMADVLLYLIRMADKLDVDLMKAAERKLAINHEKYPPHLARGSNKNYTEL